jgi:outer membrane protein OmpA-like peptidoglycan-associated protein
MAECIDRVDGAPRELIGDRVVSPASYPTRTLLTWSATLAVVWLALCSPWSWGWNGFIGALVLLAAAIGNLAVTRRALARREATQQVLRKIDRTLSALPAGIKRNTPLVLVAGTPDAILEKAFGQQVIRVADTAIWVRAGDPASLMHLADALKRWRDGQGPDAVAYLLDANACTEHASLVASLSRWRSAIAEAGRAVGYSLPVCVALYANVLKRTADECPWFGVSGVSDLKIDTLPDLISARLTQYADTCIPEDREPRACRAAYLDMLARWACGAVLPVLVDHRRQAQPIPIQAFGVTAIQGHPTPDSLLARFSTNLTGLVLPGIAISSDATRYPLPEPLIRGIAPQPVRHALPRALAHAFLGLVTLFCAAAASSAWQNRNLVARIQDDMARYRAITPTMNAARLDALKAVKGDRGELDGYARSGLPPRLGLGFYRAGRLLPVANALIAGYELPAPPPSTIELDSLSLFKSASVVLNPGSNRVLVSALDMIKAHPDKRVLVAGHTDNVGDANRNVALSEARAASVRNWLADASGIPTSHFAIQGYGDTRPKASNNTQAGRTANRRVEITLVPDCRDDRNNGTTPEGQSACLFN